MHKLDLAYFEKSICQEKNLNKPIDESLCVIIDEFELCCLGFMGDVGTEPFAKMDSFNTTDEFQGMMQSNEFIEDFQLLGHALHIQFDFQIQTLFSYRSELLQDFQTKFDNVISEFYEGKMFGYFWPCIKQIYSDSCNNNATKCNNKMLQIINSSNFGCSAESKDPNTFEDQLNVNYPHLYSEWCNNGKFPAKYVNSKIPYTFWEADEEVPIRKLVTTIESKEMCPEFPPEHEWYITTNLEPEKFDIFMMPEGDHFEDFLRGFITVHDIEYPNVIFLAENLALMSFVNLKKRKVYDKILNIQTDDWSGVYEIYSINLTKNLISRKLLHTIDLPSKNDAPTKIKQSKNQFYAMNELSTKISLFHINIQKKDVQLNFFKTFELPLRISSKTRSESCKTVDIYSNKLFITCIAENDIETVNNTKDFVNKNMVKIYQYAFDINSDKINENIVQSMKFTSDYFSKISNVVAKITEKPDSTNSIIMNVWASGLKGNAPLSENNYPSSTFFNISIDPNNSYKIYESRFIMFGHVLEVKTIQNWNNFDEMFQQIFKDSACFAGVGINNSSITKCKAETYDEEPSKVAQRKSNYTVRYLLIPSENLQAFDYKKASEPGYYYASLCDKNFLIGDLGYAIDASVDIISKGNNPQAFILHKAIHPTYLDSFSKIFCGAPKPQPAGTNDKVTGKAYGITFSLPNLQPKSFSLEPDN